MKQYFANMYGGTVIKSCLGCKKKFSHFKSDNKKFCSVKCFRKWQKKNYKGKRIRPTPSLRMKILETFDFKCAICREKVIQK